MVGPSGSAVLRFWLIYVDCNPPPIFRNNEVQNKNIYLSPGNNKRYNRYAATGSGPPSHQIRNENPDETGRRAAEAGSGPPSRQTRNVAYSDFTTVRLMSDIDKLDINDNVPTRNIFPTVITNLVEVFYSV